MSALDDFRVTYDNTDNGILLEHGKVISRGSRLWPVKTCGWMSDYLGYWPTLPEIIAVAEQHLAEAHADG